MRFLIVLTLLFTFAFTSNAQSREAEPPAAGEIFSGALRARQAGSLEAALSLFREVTQKEDFSLSDYAQFEIGESYFANRQYLAAMAEYSKVISLHPQSILLARANLMVGKSQLNLKNFSLAIKTLRQLIKKYPAAREASEARFLIAQTFESQKKWQAAYLAYRETDFYHPLSPFGKKARLALKDLKRKHKTIVAKLPRFKASAPDLFKNGMSYFDDGDFEMAANVFSLLAREYPRSKYIGKAWLMLGRAQLQQNSFSSAISDLERAAAFDGRAHYYLGLAYGRRGFFDRAISALGKVPEDSGLADEAAYWIGYYHELKGDQNAALQSYYQLIKTYPYSSSVSAAIWRMGRIYYWNNEFKNAATYLHLAQLYPTGEDSARCYFFEAKALERLGNRLGALAVYKKLRERFDHTYYAYRAQEKLDGNGIYSFSLTPFSGNDFSEALDELDGKDPEGLAAIMEIWEQTNGENLPAQDSHPAQAHLIKYKELMNLGLSGYAADEARYLVGLTSEEEKDFLQTRLGETLAQLGNYRAPLRFADRKVRAALLAGKPQSLSKKIWQLAYPRGYWKNICEKAGRFGLDPYLVLAVIREESRFNPKATSRSSARGLMQIMPRTGKGIARELKNRRYYTQHLYRPALNIEMGTYYLSNLIKNFGNNFYLALAGYNGGPNRIKKYVKNWYDGDLKLVDIDEFVESIPNRETRLYVQKVMGSYFEYKRLYDRKRG
jgi:soluble lytic murein transglycosylase